MSREQDIDAAVSGRIQALTESEIWNIVRAHYGRHHTRDFRLALHDALVNSASELEGASRPAAPEGERTP